MQFAFPQFSLNQRKVENKLQVWDPIRKKWLIMAGEEYVRQQFIQFLVQSHKVPEARIGVEKGIMYHEMPKRIDVIVFDKEARPLLLCECKAPDIALTEDTLHQLARYNVQFQAPYLVLTNGVSLHVFSKNDSGTYDLSPSGWFPAMEKGS